MEGEEAATGLSPTVSRVLAEFVSRIRSDDRVANDVADRLEVLLTTGSAPKAEELLDAFTGSAAKDQP